MTCDLFITHAWRYHDDWKRMVEMLNAQGPRTWRNFSLPWYDPALDARTESGGKIVRWNLESQIIPVHAVLLLTSLFRQPGCRKWLDYEIEMARKHRKPVIGVPAWGEAEVTPDVRDISDVIADWDGTAILDRVRQLGASGGR